MVPSSSFNIFSFLILTVLLLLHVTQSDNSSTTDMSELLASVDHGISKRVVMPGIDTLNPYQQETYEVSNRRFLGRKIVFKQYGRRSSMSTTSTPSGSAFSVRNSINVNVQPQRLMRNIRSERPHTHRRVKVNIPGNFIPLNADYYVPRPHPPKNNYLNQQPAVQSSATDSCTKTSYRKFCYTLQLISQVFATMINKNFDIRTT